MRGGEHVWGGILDAPDLGPEPLGGVHSAAFCQVVGADRFGQGSDFGGLGVGGVVFPQPYLGIDVVFKFFRQRERCAVGVDWDRRAAGGVDADADDVLGIELLVPGFGLFDCPLDDGLEAVDVVLRVLARDVRVARVGEDPELARRVFEDGAAQLAAVGEIDQQRAAGVGSVV